MKLIIGVMIPFFGTVLGATMVFFMKNRICSSIEKLLLGFAAGVMVAASIWSLLLPSLDMAYEQGVIVWVPPVVGFLIGIVFLLVTNHFLFCHYFNEDDIVSFEFKKTIMMIIAVTLHNIPEGMAVGVVFAGAMHEHSIITMTGAFSLAIGIAIQNFPEGAIISMPLKGGGMSKRKSFVYGVLSGVVEPIGAFITIMLTKAISVVLPYLLSFAAGAMIYVVVLELVPELKKGDHSSYGVIGIILGFFLMMSLDIIFG